MLAALISTLKGGQLNYRLLPHNTDITGPVCLSHAWVKTIMEPGGG